ncbi:MAG: tetratricopeptide repeat-containing sensor histidine kinase [Mucilaginibacter sp.]
MIKYRILLFGIFILLNAGLKAQSLSNKNAALIAIKTVDSINANVKKIYLLNPVKALEMSKTALLLSSKANYQSGIGQSYLNMGMTYWAQTYYPISLFYINTALDYFKPTEHVLLSDCYRQMGRDYVDLQNFKQGEVYLNKATTEAGNDQDEYVQVLTEQSYLYLKSRQFDKSLVYVAKAIKICKQLPKPGEIGILYGRITNVYIQQKQFDKARAYSDTTLAMSIAIPNRRLETTVWVGLSAIAYDQKKYADAIKYAKKGAALADSLGILEMAANANRWLIRSYKIIHDNDNSLYYQETYIKLQDSLNKINKQKSLSLIQDYFSLSKKMHDLDVIQQQNKLNDIQIKSQRDTIYNLIIAVAFLIIFLYLLYGYSKQKSDLTKQLQAQNAEVTAQNKLIETQADKLNELNQLKNTLLAVIGHDLKTPLANLRNIVDMFGEGYLSAEELQRVMQQLNPAISGAELTLSNLVEWAGNLLKGNNINLTTVDLITIVHELQTIVRPSTTQKQISFITDIADGQQVLADQNHFKMILRNLVSNAVKFTPTGGTIIISAKQEADKLTISVTDTGKGMTPDEVSSLFSKDNYISNIGTDGEKGTGIGLLLCRQMAMLNGWQIGVTSTVGKGSTFYVTLPAKTDNE